MNKLLNLIARCSSPFPGEAATAQSMAYAMMMRLGITWQSLYAYRTKDNDKFLSVFFFMSGEYAYVFTYQPPRPEVRVRVRSTPLWKSGRLMERESGIAWARHTARLLRRKGKRNLAKLGDRLFKISTQRRELFYLVAAFMLIKSR